MTNRKQSRLNLAALNLLALILLFLSGCALKDTESSRQFHGADFDLECAAEDQDKCSWPDKDLPRRFVRYWSLRYTGPLQDLFAMEAPFFQYVVPQERYNNFFRSGFDLSVDKIRIYSVKEINKNLADVVMQVEHLDSSGRSKTMSYQDRWVLVEDEWYHVVQNSLVFPQVP